MNGNNTVATKLTDELKVQLERVLYPGETKNQFLRLAVLDLIVKRMRQCDAKL